MKRTKPTHKIRGIDDLFGDSDAEVQGNQDVSIAKIRANPNQPRHYFDPQKLEELARSIEKHGFRGSLWVRALPDGQYELVAGERRYRAAKMAGLQTISVLICDVNDDDALELALAENLLREDLNPVEETEGVLDLLSLKLKKKRDEILADLKAIANAQKYKTKNLDNVIQDRRDEIANILKTLGSWTPESFYVNRVPVLSLPGEVAEALQEGKLDYTKAREIAKIKDKSSREQLLEDSIIQSLSLTKIKDRVKVLHPPEKAVGGLQSRWNKAITRVKKAKPWKDPSRAKKLENLLKQIDKLLEEE